MPYSDYSGWDHFLRDPQDMAASASKKDWHAITHKPFCNHFKGKQIYVVVHAHRMWPFTSSGGRGARGLMTAARGTWDCLAKSALQGML